MNLRTLGKSMRSMASRAINFFGKGGSGFFGSAFVTLSGSNRDWNKDAGPRYDNSAVFSAIQYLTRKINGEPRLIVQKQTTGLNGKVQWVESPHELPKIVRRGSIMSQDVLFAGVILSMVVSGNGYWIKDRLPNGQIIGFVFVPYWQMSAVRDRPSPFGDRQADGTQLVTFYEFRNPDGSRIPFKVTDVIHFKWGVDPARPEYGLSPIFASLREIVTDNEAATLGAALLGNAGIPGVAISPKAETNTPELTPEQRTDLNTKFARRVSGDMAGTPFLAPFPCDFTVIGFSPDKLVLKETRAGARAAILSPLGLDPMVLGFPSEQKTYSNFEEALRAAWRSACKPLLRLISEAIDEQCFIIDYVPTAGESRVYWDLTEVPEEQEDKYKEADMIRADWMGDGIDRATFKAGRGYAPEAGDVGLYFSHSKPVMDKVNPETVKKALTAMARESVPNMRKYEATMEEAF